VKLDMKLNYIESYLPSPRHRKMRERQASQNVSLDLKEVTTDEAPVVLRTHDLKHYCDGIQPTDYRQYNGTLYTQVRLCDLKNPESNIEANQPVYAEQLLQFYRNYNRLSKEEALQAVSAYLDRYLLIDGVLWQKSGEPMYQVCTFGLGHNHGSTALMLANSFNPNCRWDNYYCALQHDEAIAAAVKTATARGDDQSIERILSRRHYIEVLDPAAVRANPQAWGGKGNPFLNTLDAITASAPSALDAGLLAMSAASAIAEDSDRKPYLLDQIHSAKERSPKEKSDFARAEAEPDLDY